VLDKMPIRADTESGRAEILQARKAIFTSGARGSKRKGTWLNACVLTATAHMNS
jgi:hypothetical protein